MECYEELMLVSTEQVLKLPCFDLQMGADIDPEKLWVFSWASDDVQNVSHNDYLVPMKIEG